MPKNKQPEVVPENCLRRSRLQAGISQEELADRAGIARQTVGGIESGQYNPSLSVAFRLANALCKKIEDVFSMPQAVPTDITADWCNMHELPECGEQVYLGRPKSADNYIAYPVNRDSIYSDYNAIVKERHNNSLTATIIDSNYLQSSAVIIAGCSPALAFLKKRINNRYTNLNIHWVNTNSMSSLLSLSQGYVHLAGIHIFDEETGEYNLPIVKRILEKKYLVVNLCHGEQGFITTRNNPKGIHSFDDLFRQDIRLVNREQGAETRRLLDSGLQKAGVHFNAVAGYDFLVRNHLEVAQAVSLGGADCGISLRALANLYHLDFIPLARERYDLVILHEHLANPGVQAILDCLSNHSFHLELEASGYSPEQCGKQISAGS